MIRSIPLVAAAFTLACAALSFSANAQNLDDVWQAFEESDRVKARSMLEEAVKNDATKVDATCTLIMLNGFEEKEGSFKLMKDAFDDMDDPSPYLYALWYDKAVTGGYGKKKPERIAFMNRILESDKVNKSQQIVAHYLIGTHAVYSGNPKGRKEAYAKVHSLRDWQFTGVFDNSSGSGFDKEYPPITHPEPGASFLSASNSKISWFEPTKTLEDCWVPTIYYLTESAGTVYAQTFLESPEERDVVLGFSGSGSLKFWLNDQLLVSQEEEYSLEMDYYKIKAKLAKGTNRLLVQVGYTSQETDYPNFMVRVLDQNNEPITDLKLSTTHSPYTKATFEPELIPHFAETYFQARIEADPGNVIHSVMLARCYLRAGKHNEAIKVINACLKDHPNNILLHYQLLLSYQSTDDRTNILKQVEDMRALDEDILLIHFYDFNIDFGKEDYTACQKHLEHIENALGSDNESYQELNVRLMLAKKEYQQAMTQIEWCYQKFPESEDFLGYKFRLVKSQSGSKGGSLKLLEKFLKDNYDFSVYQLYLSELDDAGMRSKYQKTLLKLYETHPMSTNYRGKLVHHNYNIQQYDAALAYVEEGLGVSPYDYSLWRDKGYLLEALGKKEQAIAAFDMAIHHNPNLFDTREKRRELLGQDPLTELLRRPGVEDMVRSRLEEASASDDNFEYIVNDANVIIFPEGSSSELNTLAVKVLNEAGVEAWKEASINYNSAWQSLHIDKADVIKQNGQKIAAERNYNDLVFPNLQPGDAVIIEYRLENYTGGQLSKEYWASHTFNSFVPTKHARLKIVAPKDLQLHFEKLHIDSEMEKSELSEFTVYEWDLQDLDKCKDESYMEELNEIGMDMQVSTIDSWTTISEWYRDLAMPRAREDHNLDEVFQSIFEAGTDKLTDLEKAQAIYAYICENINYSSVAFRQSNYVPQKPMKTISTQLGDCKDLSTLYHTLARKAGLSTNLVLVNTRNNGENTMRVPSTEFNHCIVRISLPDTLLFQELTDEKLPFGAMPNSLINAQALIIPNAASDQVEEELMHLPSPSNLRSKVFRESTITVEDKDLAIQSTVRASGEVASNYRHYFDGLTEERTKESVEYVVSGYFENSLKVDTYAFENMNNLEPSVTMKVDFNVENEVKSIGGLKAVKPNLFEKIATLDVFPDMERKYPFLYWAYDSMDEYHTATTMVLPPDAKIIEVPANHSVSNTYMDYKLEVTQSGQEVTLKRTVVIKEKYVPAEDYNDLRQTIKSIIEAEDVYIAFK